MNTTESAGPRGEGDEPEWMPVTLMFARDRSADGWMFTKVSDVRTALAEQQLIAAVAAEGPSAAEDLILARIAVRKDGALATLPDPAGPPVGGRRLEEVISELAHSMKTVISLDGEISIGTAGVPLEAMPEGMDRATDDRRVVYVWPGTDRYVATAAAMGVKEELTWHDAQGWTVLASRHAPQRVLTDFAATMERYPRAHLKRTGPERSFEFIAGKGDKDLRLLAWWGPWLEPIIELPKSRGPRGRGMDPDTRGLFEFLAHPRLGQDEMDPHPDLTPEQPAALREAMGDRDGGGLFLARASAAFDLPEIAARLAEQSAGESDPELVGEVVKPEQGRFGLARATMKEMQSSDSVLPVAMERRVGRMITGAEVVLALFLLSVAVFGYLPGPWWVWAGAAVLVLADVVNDVLIKPWRDRRAEAAAPPVVPPES